MKRSKLEIEYQILTTKHWIWQHERMPMKWNQDQIKILNKHLETLKDELKTYEETNSQN